MAEHIKNNDIPNPDFNKLRKRKIGHLGQTFQVLFCLGKKPKQKVTSEQEVLNRTCSGGRKPSQTGR